MASLEFTFDLFELLEQAALVYYEQVAQRDPQSLISTAESVVESLLSGEHV